jgi:phospho-N-acetylmuramoyl-pentapeptide-transferase
LDQSQQPSLWAPAVASFFITVLLLPPYIAQLKKMKIQQYLREEGPQSHKAKAGTPSAGGVCFIVACVVSFLAAYFIFPSLQHDIPVLAVLGVGVICGAIGFLDDAAKFKQKANKGISAKKRLIAEAALGVVLGVILSYVKHANQVDLYFTPLTRFDQIADWAPFVIFLSTFMIMATTNAVNLHDGMDGLAAGTCFLTFFTMGIMFLALNQLPLAALAATICGGLAGFLIFNKKPAKIFMGDTGSLFLGGMMGALVVASGTVVYFVPLSLLYIAETVSVMLQVVYFKMTKPYTPEKPMSLLQIAKVKWSLKAEGKRLFLMAPLHHHFEALLEKKGVKEGQVVAGFWAVQALLCAAVLSIFFALRLR